MSRHWTPDNKIRATRSNTRRNGVELYDVKHPLQVSRDKYGQGLRRHWPADADPTLTSPAGFAFGRKPEQNTQNAVMQALMNIPVFVNWARGHTNSDFSHDYWSTTTPALPQTTFAFGHVNNRYLPADHPGTTLLLRKARRASYRDLLPEHNPFATLQPRPGALQSAYTFYDWVTRIDQITELMSSKMDERMKLDHERRNHELDALFQFAIEEKFICQGFVTSLLPGWDQVGLSRCAGVRDFVTDYPFIELPSDVVVQEGLETALEWYLRSYERVLNCTVCNHFQNTLVHRSIAAAPQILRIVIQGQYDEPFNIPNKLCLTDMQKNCSLPLNYTLSSVIAHAADDEYDTIGLHHSESESESDAGYLYRRSEDTENYGDYGATYFDDDDAGDDDITDLEQYRMDGIEGWEMRSATSNGSERTIPEDAEFEFDEGTGEYFEENFKEVRFHEGEFEERNSSRSSEDEDAQPPAIDWGQWAINVRSRKGDFHARDAHVRALARPQARVQKLNDNPQWPPLGDPCEVMLDKKGYRVSILTYTRDRLTGADLKREKLADENRRQ
ncbi:hypothetical protein IQ07DRAFT_659568 [Pyrenochaeta sp. DS3sAY3a]|nr:hypothetical protein IQ07DRAFT_659568 [Pyrenochaeta sp. DS3sAY3a]